MSLDRAIDHLERLIKEVEEARTAYIFSAQWREEWKRAFDSFIDYDRQTYKLHVPHPMTAAKRRKRDKVNAARKAAQRNKGR